MNYQDTSHHNRMNDTSHQNRMNDTSHQNRMNEGMMSGSSGDPLIELPPGGVITTHCVSSVIKPGRNKSQDPLQFVKIESTELCKKVSDIFLSFSDRPSISCQP